VAGGAGCITAAANVNSRIGAAVYANWTNPAGAAHQATLTQTRRAVVSAPLIPGLKALVARRTGDEGWTVMRPPHMKLAPDAAERLFAAMDASLALDAAA
jgi:4-hydroxy-tetrahydrodipicolinate synthase